MEPVLQKFKWAMGLLLVSLLLVLLVLGKSLFFPSASSQPQCGVKDEPQMGFCGNASYQTEEAERGSKLFKANCARCHNVGDAKLVGPGMRDVFERVPPPAEKWLRAFIGNADAVYKTGDPYVKFLREKYNTEHDKKHFNHRFLFSEQEWTDLLAYLKTP